MKPIYIAVSSRVHKDGWEKICVTNTYLNIINKENIIPLIIPPLKDLAKLEELFKICSGFILTGGDDINPQLYLQENSASTFDDRHDYIDFAIINYAFKHNLPLLGICRGMQAINVYLNGTLTQNLSFAMLFKHHNGNHRIKTINLAQFEQINNQIYSVNSYHHQGIDQLGKDLIVIAISEDNLIEGFFHKIKPIYATQWHLEQTPNHPLTQTIINCFLSAVVKQLKQLPT